jgi:hypothetical protein
MIDWLADILRRLRGEGPRRQDYVEAHAENARRATERISQISDKVQGDAAKRQVRSRVQRKRVERDISALDSLIRATRHGDRL